MGLLIFLPRTRIYGVDRVWLGHRDCLSRRHVKAAHHSGSSCGVAGKTAAHLRMCGDKVEDQKE